MGVGGARWGEEGGGVITAKLCECMPLWLATPPLRHLSHTPHIYHTHLSHTPHTHTHIYIYIYIYIYASGDLGSMNPGFHFRKAVYEEKYNCLLLCLFFFHSPSLNMIRQSWICPCFSIHTTRLIVAEKQRLRPTACDNRIMVCYIYIYIYNFKSLNIDMHE